METYSRFLLTAVIGRMFATGIPTKIAAAASRTLDDGTGSHRLNPAGKESWAAYSENEVWTACITGSRVRMRLIKLCMVQQTAERLKGWESLQTEYGWFLWESSGLNQADHRYTARKIFFNKVSKQSQKYQPSLLSGGISDEKKVAGLTNLPTQAFGKFSFPAWRSWVRGLKTQISEWRWKMRKRKC